VADLLTMNAKEAMRESSKESDFEESARWGGLYKLNPV
jgi:hypothetical protein